MHCYKNIQADKAYRSIGTLGGGNHFIEVDQGEDGDFYLVIHSGSRHLGIEVTNFYINQGEKVLKEKGCSVPHETTYLEGQLMQEYLEDLQIVQYEGYTSPKFYLKDPLCFESGGASKNEELLKNLTVKDKIDGDLSNQIKILTNSVVDL